MDGSWEFSSGLEHTAERSPETTEIKRKIEGPRPEEAVEPPAEEAPVRRPVESALGMPETELEDVVATFAENATAECERVAALSAKDVEELTGEFKKGLATWDVPGGTGSDLSSLTKAYLESSVQRDTDRQMSKGIERAHAAHATLKHEQLKEIEDLRTSALDNIRKWSLLPASEQAVNGIRHSCDQAANEIEAHEFDEASIQEIRPRVAEELHDRYMPEIEKELHSRRSLETVTPERKDAVLGLFERATSAVVFRGLTYGLDGLMPGLGTFTRHLKTVWEAGEAAIGDGPVGITVPIGDYLGVTFTDSRRGIRLRLDITFSEHPTIGPETAGPTDPHAIHPPTPLDRAPEVTRALEPRPTREERPAGASSPLRPILSPASLSDSGPYGAGAAAISVETGKWRVAVEPHLFAATHRENDRPSSERTSRSTVGDGFSEGSSPIVPAEGDDSARAENAFPSIVGVNHDQDEPTHVHVPEAASSRSPAPTSVHHHRTVAPAALDASEFLLVVVHGDTRDLHGCALARHGMILGQRALHRRVFNPAVPASARKSAELLRRIGAVVFYDHALGVVAYIDVDLRTRKPSCRMIGVLTEEVGPPSV